MTVEGEKDDVSGVGQTLAAHDPLLQPARAELASCAYMQKGVGHYGVFNGSRFRSEIVPRIADFARRARRKSQTRIRSKLRASAAFILPMAPGREE